MSLAHFANARSETIFQGPKKRWPPMNFQQIMDDKANVRAFPAALCRVLSWQHWQQHDVCNVRMHARHRCPGRSCGREEPFLPQSSDRCKADSMCVCR